MVTIAMSATLILAGVTGWAGAAEAPSQRPPPVLEFMVAVLAALLTLATICIPSRRRLR